MVPYKSKLYHWVNENFSDNSSSAPSMNQNASNTSGNNLPYAGADFTGGQGVPVKNDIAGEKLKNSFNGISTFAELKNKADTVLNDIKVAIEDCISKDANHSSYAKVLDLLQKPEILSILEHIRLEISIKEQDKGQYN
jgi:hypothetical protein